MLNYEMQRLYHRENFHARPRPLGDTRDCSGQYMSGLLWYLFVRINPLECVLPYIMTYIFDKTFSYISSKHLRFIFSETIVPNNSCLPCLSLLAAFSLFLCGIRAPMTLGNFVSFRNFRYLISRSSILCCTVPISVSFVQTTVMFSV